MISRIAQGTQAQLRVALYVDGVLTNPSGATTIQVLREDGTELVPAGTATQAVDTGIKGFTLTPAETADLDVLTAHWTAVGLGGADQVFTTEAEIVGGFYFTVAEAKAGAHGVPSLSTFSVDQITSARTMAEQAIEEECGAFVPRYAREIFSGDSAMPHIIGYQGVSGYAGDLLVVRERILRVTAATLDGTALDSAELALLIPDRDGVYRASGWPSGHGNIELKYEHGFKQVPALVKRAALLLARRYLVESPVDPRTTRVTQEGALIEFQVDPSLPFDIPEVNAIVARYGRRALRLT